MTSRAPTEATTSKVTVPPRDDDTVVIGAGIAGLYQLIRLRELGLRVRVIEAGNEVGGTWYWNRCPGARFDSESDSYGDAFLEELLLAWNWTEHFAPQPETLRDLQHVADRFDLRRDIQFNTRVPAAHWHEAWRGWELTLADGSRPSHRVPAHAQLVRAPAQRPDHRRRATRDQGERPGHLSALPGSPRLVPAHGTIRAARSRSATKNARPSARSAMANAGLAPATPSTFAAWVARHSRTSGLAARRPSPACRWRVFRAHCNAVATNGHRELQLD